MPSTKKIKSALLSVYYKDRLEAILKEFERLNVKLYSTGGTQEFIEKNGYKSTTVESLTNYPSVFGGRVKTLHPKVFGGILVRRENKQDQTELKQYDIPEIDLVIVDLYPFEETLKKTTDEDEIIEKIDIGGIALIRAAAKNFNDVLIISSRNQYDDLIKILKEQNGETTLEQRKHFAALAFGVSSGYDTAIFKYFNKDNAIPFFRESYSDAQVLRYGENPHQQGIFYGHLNTILEKLNGKELSYNNIVDIDAAIQLISEFTGHTFAIIKHTNACGIASADTSLNTWKRALAGDPVSAFGGVIISNKTIDEATAKEINELFFEVLIAPSFNDGAMKILMQKKNRIILKHNAGSLPNKQFKTALNGILQQDTDTKQETPEDLKPITDAKATPQQIIDLLFANKIVKHLKSNAIVLAKNAQLIGMGCGQTSRVDALKQAIAKAKLFGFDTNGAVLSSDAFFPFSDCVQIAHENGIAAIIQPGGSVRDKDSIDLCNTYKLPMVFTGFRHFKH
jgi:phosphoribosylaminoimidazolecarboxamide formyltransferase / IMP cyclohydrolase